MKEAFPRNILHCSDENHTYITIDAGSAGAALSAQYFEIGESQSDRADAARKQRQRDFVEELERDHDRFKQQEAYDQRERITKDAAVQRERQIIETGRVRNEIEAARKEAARRDCNHDHNYTRKPRQ